MLLRCTYEKRNDRYRIHSKALWDDDVSPQLGPRRFAKFPVIHIAAFLVVGTLFLPAHPWRHMTSTLIYDVVSATSMGLVTKHFSHKAHNCLSNILGANPLGNLNYNPAEDPYYISNLDQPVDPFIASALEGLQFKNIFHIILESMRDDSYPYKEGGLLDKHIKENMERIPESEGGVPVTTENITPFISSLAENIISWETMWSTIPFTDKALLGRTCLEKRFALILRLLWNDSCSSRLVRRK